MKEYINETEKYLGESHKDVPTRFTFHWRYILLKNVSFVRHNIWSLEKSRKTHKGKPICKQGVGSNGQASLITMLLSFRREQNIRKQTEVVRIS